ncbi:hypothetical protein FVE85_2678 [Porphyridium purpureum]|uniref:Uncharacterized protein n=1 Tax=Porphyridium purpureum TaxID=35688 RepID=A0A5J4YVK3_PORPP|nr:hypothetical protein FVE85_2678 [Porphyridium purpureum]|eukprot:POR4884..scf227_4
MAAQQRMGASKSVKDLMANFEDPGAGSTAGSTTVPKRAGSVSQTMPITSSKSVKALAGSLAAEKMVPPSPGAARGSREASSKKVWSYQQNSQSASKDLQTASASQKEIAEAAPRQKSLKERMSELEQDANKDRALSCARASAPEIPRGKSLNERMAELNAGKSGKMGEPPADAKEQAAPPPREMSLKERMAALEANADPAKRAEQERAAAVAAAQGGPTSVSALTSRMGAFQVEADGSSKPGKPGKPTAMPEGRSMSLKERMSAFSGAGQDAQKYAVAAATETGMKPSGGSVSSARTTYEQGLAKSRGDSGKFKPQAADGPISDTLKSRASAFSQPSATSTSSSGRAPSQGKAKVAGKGVEPSETASDDFKKAFAAFGN